MTSTIRGSDGFDSADAVAGTAKAWVNYDATVEGGSINASYNVASLTDVATARWIVNFANDLEDGNFVAAGSAGNASGITTIGQVVTKDDTWTASAAALRFVGSNDGLADRDVTTVVFFR